MNGGTRSRPRLSRRAAGLAAVSLLLATAGVVPAREYLAQRTEMNQLEHQIELLEEERGRLERRLGRLEDPEYLERVARECLGMVKPGEIAFVAVPEDGEGTPAGC